jgi:predicted ATPase
LSVEPEEIASKRPESLRQLIEGQLDRLSAPEQRILEAAAAVGSEFTARLVAAALETDTTEVAERCDDLVRQRQFLNVVNTLASNDQTDDSRYAFRHDLYRSAAFDRSSPSRLILWYRRIGEKMIADCGEHLDELSTELAYYFEHAKLFQQAAQYYALAGERAIRRFANSEAIGHFRRGVELLEKAPSSVERDELELRLQVDVALPLVAIQGQASDEVTAVLSRARDLNQKLGETPQTFGAIRALHWLSFAHADYRGAFELCEQLSRIAERVNNPDFRAEALRARANSSSTSVN